MESASTSSITSKKASVKQMPAKLGKNIKRRIRRISSHFNHVTPPQEPKDSAHTVTSTLPLITTSIVSPHSPAFPLFSYRKKRTTSTASRSISSSLRSSASSTLPPDTMSERSALAPFPPTPPSTVPLSPDGVSHAQAATTSPVAEETTDEGGMDIPPAGSEPSPQAPYIESEVPNPFLIDDEGTSSGNGGSTRSLSPNASPPAISPSPLPNLSIPLSPATPPQSELLPPPPVEKDVPPIPDPESESDEEDAPDLYLSGLIVPSMFLPIPNTDPLSTLLTKYIYPLEERPVRDVTGDWQRGDFHTLVMTNSWRALAKMARDRLVTADPEDPSLILNLWYIRLACLARLRLFNQTAAECTNFFVVLNGIEPPEARAWVFEKLLPFELEVMQARVKYWAGDQMGYLDALNVLLNKCKKQARQKMSDATTVSMWKERGARVCLIIASQLVEMKEFRAATKLLEPLCDQGDTSTAALRSSVGRIYLQSGQIKTAAKQFSLVAEDPAAGEDLKDVNSSLLASAEGDWERADSLLKSVIEKDSENFVAVNNRSVALLGQGKLKEAIEVLEVALKASPSSVVVAEPFLFNLSTLYELRSSTAVDSKRKLLIEVAKWSGDGLRVTCLKMPTN